MKRPLRNLLSLGVADAGSKAIGFAVTVYLARVLGPEGFGAISIGMAVLGYLLFAASPGVQTVEARNVAATGGNDGGRIGGVLAFRLVLSLLLFGGAGAVALLAVGDTRQAFLLFLYSGALVPLALTLDWFFSGRELFPAVGASRLLNAAVYAAAVFLLVRTPHDILLAPVAFVLGASASALFLGALYRTRHGALHLVFSPGLWKRIAAENLPVGLALVLGQTVSSLPPIALGLFRDPAGAGHFGAAMKLVSAVLMLDRILNALLLPVMARHAASPSGEVPRLFAVVGRALLAMILPAGTLSIALAPWLVPLLFGPGYAPAVATVQILSLYMMLTLFSSLCVVTLIAAGKESRYTSIMVRAAVVLVVAVGALSLYGGVTGAAWGVVIGETTALILLAREVRAVVQIRLASVVRKPVLAAVPMAACLLLAPLLHPLAVGAACLTVFLAGAGAGRVMNGEDLAFLRERLL